MQKQNVIIVGGGICGLHAASLLADECNVTILEGNSRLGGRILDVGEGGFSGIVKRGAEFIHGDAQLSFSLLEKAGIEYKEVDGKMYSMKLGKVEETEFFIEGWDELMQRMEEVKVDITLHEFLAYYFKEDKYGELRRQAMRYAEGYDIADPDKVSVMTLYKEWSADEATYQLDKGYGALIAYLENECEQKGASIQVDSVVQHVEWSEGKVRVQAEAGQSFEADRVIVTIPLGVLQKQGQRNSITFSPTLDTHIAAAQKIGFGAVVKASLEFKEAFWDRDMAFVFGDQLFQTWWTQMPYESNVLTGWAGGIKAKTLSAFSEEELHHAAISSIAEIYNMPLASVKENLKAINVANWQINEWSNGAYSYPTPATKEAREVLNTPASNTVYFAGEALYDGAFSGTVEAALLTAQSTVKAILDLR
ncbi:MAG: FAD-dependent oxidoreductase [Sphingobacteriales bacterium]|nr:MAG: FAD-dependent oxidoreductase [Sphingobacteriales bacterium]